MKKIICITLSVLLLFCLCACGGQQEKEKAGAAWEGLEGLHIGFGKAVYTPELGTPLAGYGNSRTRLSSGNLDDVYLLCIAATDGEETLLLYAMDYGSMSEYWVNLARERVTATTGLPAERIIFCATHSHSAPDLGLTPEDVPAITDAHNKSLAAAEEAALMALNDLAPATVSGAYVETEGLAFVRHYLQSGGTYAGDNFGDWNSGIITDYSMENDPQMVLVKFDREGDKKDLLLMNFQVHPCYTGGIDKNVLSSDVVGRTRDYVAEQTGMDVIYFTGAAGNQNTNSKILKDAHNLTIDEYAEKLGNYAIDALPTLKTVEGNDIAIDHQIYTGNVWTVDDPELVEKAKEVNELFQNEGREVATPLAKQYGFASVYDARETIRHSTMDDTRDMEMNAIRIGGVGFVTAAYEMFSLQGTYIKTNSPFEFTAVCTMAGPHNNYIPSQKAYDYGCYESQTSYFVAGTAEIVADKFVEMLKGIQN